MAKERDFSAQQLAAWLGLEPRHVRRAETRGLIPPPDVADERWSEQVARTLPDRVEEILSAVGDEQYAEQPAASSAADRRGAEADLETRKRSFGPHQLAKELGLKRWQVDRAVLRGLLPGPDANGRRWSVETVEALPPGRGAEIREVIGDHFGLGSVAAAERLAERTRMSVERADVRTLADQEVLAPVGEFRGHPVYGLESLDGLPEQRIADVVREREAWIARSLTAREAAALLEWAPGKFEVTAERCGLLPCPLGRYDRARVEALPGHPDAQRGRVT